MPKINQLNSKTVPNNNDEFPFHDPNTGTTRKITRGDLLGGAPLPASSVNSQAIAPNSVGPAQRTGGFYLVNHTFNNATGPQTITGVPFKPKAVLVNYGSPAGANFAISSGRAVDGSPIVQSSEAATQAGSSGGSAASTANAVVRVDSAGSSNFRGQITSFNSDGITVDIAVTNATTSNRIFNFLFMG